MTIDNPPPIAPGNSESLSDVAAIDESHLQKYGYKQELNRALGLFSSFGVIVGIYANSWDHTAFVTNIVILPLTFLGGVFYSVDVLPSPWHELSHLNPIFYLLNAVRYGFLGTSDVSVPLSLAVTAALAAAVVAWSAWLFRTGHRLKP